MHFLGSNATEMRCQPELSPGPRWESLHCSLDPVDDFKGAASRRERERMGGTGSAMSPSENSLQIQCKIEQKHLETFPKQLYKFLKNYNNKLQTK